MIWLNAIHHRIGLERVYEGHPPSLKQARVANVRFCMFSSSVQIVLRFSELPQNVPKKWRQRGCQAVDVELSCSTSKGLHLEKQRRLPELTEVQIKRAQTGFEVSIQECQFDLSFRCDHISIMKIACFSGCER